MSAALLVRLFFWLWFGGAVATGHWLVLQRLPPLALPATILLLTAALLALGLGVPGVRRWLDSVDLRTLVLLHIARGVGVYFLVLNQRGELPRAFAVPAGMGELVVAVMALPVVFAPLPATSRERAIRIWSIVGCINLLLVVFAMIRLSLDPAMPLRTFTFLPLSLYPTFLVPLLLAAHVIVLFRTAARRAS